MRKKIYCFRWNYPTRIHEVLHHYKQKVTRNLEQIQFFLIMS